MGNTAAPLRFPMLDKCVITTSWDDGCPLDLKVAELLQKYSVPATFYLPVINQERPSLPAAGIRELARYFDIGGHSYHHVDLTRLSIDSARNEIRNGKRGLEEITGKELATFSYPYGRYNNRIKQAVKECGFKGARTIKGLVRRITDPFQMGTMANTTSYFFARYPWQAMAAGDYSLLFFILKKNLSLQNWDRIALETLDFVSHNGGIWHFWGHSWEIDENREWNKLSDVLKAAGSLQQDALKVDNSQLLRIFKEAT
jgi:peptidoglycan/xylan/chitin deacetylase (PgdA/CDA1 family)